MRSAAFMLLAGLVISSTAMAADRSPLPQVEIAPQKNQSASFSAGLAPLSEAAAAPGTSDNSHAPVIQSISVRTDVKNAKGVTIDVVPDFHFVAPNGNAIVLHGEIIDTDADLARVHIHDAKITIPVVAQKRGAVQPYQWQCGVAQYYVTIRAFIMDADGNRSNPMEYTIHCNGG